MSISQRLREERDRLCFTQAGLAKRLGVSRNTQVNYERGARSPDATYLASLAALGADVMWVLTGIRPLMAPAPASSYSSRERLLLANYSACDEAGKRAIERMASLEAKSKSVERAPGADDEAGPPPFT